MSVVVSFIAFLLFIVPILLTVAFFTLAERKVMGTIQRRKGPNVTGFGLLQPIADGIKLIIKETTIPSQSNAFLFLVAPYITIVLSLFNWVFIPFNHAFIFADVDLSLLFFLAISSVSVYGIILAGWASNSKYAFLGALRAVAQMISYEISMGLVLLPVVLLSGSLNFMDIINFQINNCWMILPLLPSACIFFVIMLAETNRTPFDLPEAEAELVAGYNIEYSSVFFALFFLGEYNNIIVISSVFSILFLGGYALPNHQCVSEYLNFTFLTFIESFVFFFKTTLICFLFILVRALLPRYRYDQLMQVGWKVLLPLGISYYFFVLSIIFAYKGFPF